MVQRFKLRSTLWKCNACSTSNFQSLAVDEVMRRIAQSLYWWAWVYHVCNWSYGGSIQNSEKVWIVVESSKGRHVKQSSVVVQCRSLSICYLFCHEGFPITRGCGDSLVLCTWMECIYFELLMRGILIVVAPILMWRCTEVYMWMQTSFCFRTNCSRNGRVMDYIL